MRILLTNDDGLGAPGLEALISALSNEHRLIVIAPDRDRSGASQSITVGAPVDARSVGPDRWALSGTPADCVRLGARALCDAMPDLVVCGVNQGANLGTDILLSGTIGAARQAALMGLRAIAVSAVRYSGPEDADTAARFVARNIDALAGIIGAGGFVSVNAPRSARRAVVARPGRLRYDIQVVTDQASAGGPIRRLLPTARLLPATEGDSEDLQAVAEGALVLTGLNIWGMDEGLQAALGRILSDLRLE